MGALRRAGRYIAAIVSTYVVLYYPLVVPTSVLLPEALLDGTTPLIIVGTIATGVGIWYARRGHPVRNLGEFAFVLLVVSMVAGVVITGVVAGIGLLAMETGVSVGEPVARYIDRLFVAVSLLVLVASYVLAFSAVYRDGYADLKARFTS